MRLLPESRTSPEPSSELTLEVVLAAELKVALALIAAAAPKTHAVAPAAASSAAAKQAVASTKLQMPGSTSGLAKAAQDAKASSTQGLNHGAARQLLSGIKAESASRPQSPALAQLGVQTASVTAQEAGTAHHSHFSPSH